MGYDPKAGQEGYCEGGLLRLPNGDILCAMRTGGRPGVTPTPLCLSRSTDEGKTWSRPAPIADRGVWPNLAVLPNGIVGCTSGRPDNRVVFSADNGQTWTPPLRYSEGIWGRTSSYDSIMPVGRDTFLVVYDRDEEDDNGVVNHAIVGTFFTVLKK